MTELEKTLEDRCVARIEKLGGLALKLVVKGQRGFPDRTIIWRRHIWFAEFKRPKSGVIHSTQSRWAKRLALSSIHVEVIYSDEDFSAAMFRHGGPHAREV